MPQSGRVCCVFQNGNSALSIARRLGYISVVDTLKAISEETVTTQVCMCVCGGGSSLGKHPPLSAVSVFHGSNLYPLPAPFSAPQTVIEKHKMNVPETMNEVLDMSDDEGQDSFHIFLIRCPGSLFLL